MTFLVVFVALLFQYVHANNNTNASSNVTTTVVASTVISTTSQLTTPVAVTTTLTTIKPATTTILVTKPSITKFFSTKVQKVDVQPVQLYVYKCVAPTCFVNSTEPLVADYVVREPGYTKFYHFVVTLYNVSIEYEAAIYLNVTITQFRTKGSCQLPTPGYYYRNTVGSHELADSVPLCDDYPLHYVPPNSTVNDTSIESRLASLGPSNNVLNLSFSIVGGIVMVTMVLVMVFWYCCLKPHQNRQTKSDKHYY
nr:ORF3 [Serpentovirales sp.]